MSGSMFDAAFAGSPFSPERTSRLDRPGDHAVSEPLTADGHIQFPSSHLSNWEKELEAVEKKGGELMTFQWKLMREQMSTFMGGLQEVQGQIVELRKTTNAGLTKVRDDARDSVTGLDRKLCASAAEERSLRLELRSELEWAMQRVAEGVRQEAAAREALAERSRATVADFEARWTQELTSIRDGLVSLEDFARTVRSDMLRAFGSEADERKAGDDTLAQQVRSLRMEMRDGDVNRKDGVQGVREAMDQALMEQATTIRDLKTRVDHLSTDFSGSCREDLNGLRNRCRELSEELSSRFGEMQALLDKAASERSSSQTRLEQRVAEAVTKVEQESVARAVLTKELDQSMTVSNATLRSFFKDEAEGGKRAIAALAEECRNKFDSEQRTRSSELADLASRLRPQQLDRDLADLRRRCDDALARAQALEEGRVRELEAKHSLSNEDLAQQIKALREQTRGDLEEVQRSAKMAMASLEDRQRSLIDSVFQEMGHRILDSGSARLPRRNEYSLSNAGSYTCTPRTSPDRLVTGVLKLPEPSPDSPRSLATTEPFRYEALPRPKLVKEVAPEPVVEVPKLPLSAGFASLVAASSFSATEQSPDRAAGLGSQPGKRPEAVVVTGHTGPRTVNGVYRALSRKFMETPLYFCREANAYLFNSARNCSWGIGDSPTGGLVALVQDAATEAAAITGAWKVRADGNGGWVEAPGFRMVTRSRYLDESRGAMTVDSRDPSIIGTYSPTGESRHGASIYKRQEAGKYMWFDGRQWMISGSLDDHPTRCSARSVETMSKKPDAVTWVGADVVAVETPLVVASEDEIDAAEEAEITSPREDWSSKNMYGGYIDLSFPPTESSLGAGFSDLGVGDTDWVRLSETSFKEGSNDLSLDQWRLEPDLANGMRGDLWLLAAIAGVAEWPGYLNVLLPTDTAATAGRRVVKLYGLGDCNARFDMVLDDFVPCRPKRWHEGCAKPLFAKSGVEDSRVVLLQKAVAKLAGGYSKLLNHGPELVSFAWRAFAGADPQHYWWQDSQGAWQGRSSLPPKDAKKDLFEYKATGEERQGEEMFSYVKAICKRRYMACAVVKDETRGANNSTTGFGACTILGCKPVRDLKLVRLRNLGRQHSEWTGAWGNRCRFWREHPRMWQEAQETFGVPCKEDETGPSPTSNVFYMTWEDFDRIFGVVLVSPKDMQLPGQASTVVSHIYKMVARKTSSVMSALADP